MTTVPSPETSPANRIATAAYALLADRFPVACASDEFYFFPQALNPRGEQADWDDFSPETVAAVMDRLTGWEAELQACGSGDVTGQALDARLLRDALQTLREQLAWLGPHRHQPTFHLTIAAAGLAEAVAGEEPHGVERRLTGLGKFLQRAQECLEEVPELFLKLGLQMTADLESWVAGLPAAEPARTRAGEALADFRRSLDDRSPAGRCLLGADLMEIVVDRHFGCNMTVDAVRHLLQQEEAEMAELLAQEADRLCPGGSWQDAERRMGQEALLEDEPLALYRAELQRLERHCRDQGLVPADLGGQVRLSVAEVPASLRAIRAAEAYAARPGHPARGGTFFVLPATGAKPRLTPEYRFTASHENWPGHHLLDVCRWQLVPSLRRPLERPLFYEGWACLAEELMLRSGYLQGRWDRFLLARRRLARAVRGMVDLELHCGRLPPARAALRLTELGYPAGAAGSLVEKYLLRPAYQLCYTVGLRKMLALLENSGAAHPGEFAHAVLRQGEIDFASLEKVLAHPLAPTARSL